MQNVLVFVTTNKKMIGNIFKLFYTLLVITMVYGGYEIYRQGPLMMTFFDLGLKAGQASVVFFTLTLLPGMARRFNLRNPLTSSIQVVRRYFGISVFLLAFFHFVMLRVMPVLLGLVPLFLYQLFEMFGVVALTLLFVMFLTSNDFSVARLGRNWYRLHTVVYLVAWLIFLHIAVRDIRSSWGILIGITALVETVSLLYDYVQKRAVKVV
jgi:DMSO/TMAO reductase YedYZ heme-binding membrane subunit